MKKNIYILFSTLALPSLVFVFLKFFGKNEFDVPVFFQHKSEIISSCFPGAPVPYFIPDSVSSLLGRPKQPVVVLFDPAPSTQNEISRLWDELDEEKINVVQISLSGKKVWPQANMVLLNKNVYDKLIECVFFTPPGNNALLIDGKNRIRGFYDTRDRDELDRLLLEVNILLLNDSKN